MSAAELLALAERCEAATGADRELDAAIALVLNLAGDNILADRKALGWCVGGTRQPHLSGRYTASLDTAIGLVPNDLRTALVQKPDETWGCALLALKGDDRDCPESEGSTAALALCAAALRAHAAATGDAS